MKSLFNTVFGRIFLGIVLVMTLSTVHAQSAASGDSQTETTIKYLGTQEDLLVFDVSFPNPEGTKFQLTIKDQYGSQLYHNTFGDRSFFKQFLIPKGDKDRIVFIFRNGRDADVIRTFEVNVNSRVVREVAIRKLD